MSPSWLEGKLWRLATQPRFSIHRGRNGPATSSRKSSDTRGCHGQSTPTARERLRIWRSAALPGADLLVGPFDLPCSPVGKSMGARRFCLTRLSRQPALADVDPMYNSPIFWVAAFSMSSGPSCGRPWSGLLIESPRDLGAESGQQPTSGSCWSDCGVFMLPPPVRASASFRSF